LARDSLLPQSDGHRGTTIDCHTPNRRGLPVDLRATIIHVREDMNHDACNTSQAKEVIVVQGAPPELDRGTPVARDYLLHVQYSAADGNTVWQRVASGVPSSVSAAARQTA
jgi:hypothetical protein